MFDTTFNSNTTFVISWNPTKSSQLAETFSRILDYYVTPEFLNPTTARVK